MMNSKEERLIYIGPTLSGKRLLAYQVFIGGIPKYLSEMIESYPWMRKLFVPTENFREKKAEAATKGTPLFLYCQKAREV